MFPCVSRRGVRGGGDGGGRGGGGGGGGIYLGEGREGEGGDR